MGNKIKCLQLFLNFDKIKTNHDNCKVIYLKIKQLRQKSLKIYNINFNKSVNKKESLID